MLPKLIDFHGFFIPTYGVLVAIAFLTAIWITGRLSKRVGLNTELVTNLAIYCALGGMLGAKLLMYLFDWRVYWNNPGEMIALHTLQAAGVFQGGLLLAVIVAMFYIRRHRLPGLLTADVFAPGIAIGHAIGRLGCFAAGCCWGIQCDRPWAVTFTNQTANEFTGVPLFTPLHPTQLYESVAEFIIFFGLYRLFQRPHRDGLVIGWYLVAYSVVRFSIEFLRSHEQALPFGLPLSLTQWISLATLAAGTWLVLRPARHATVPAS